MRSRRLALILTVSGAQVMDGTVICGLSDMVVVGIVDLPGADRD